jgi:hypothetical protein
MTTPPGRLPAEIVLATLLTQRDAILAEMGQPDVQFGTQSVKRRPQAELDEALKRIDREIAQMQSPQSRQFTIQTSRGI